MRSVNCYRGRHPKCHGAYNTMGTRLPCECQCHGPRQQPTLIEGALRLRLLEDELRPQGRDHERT